MNDGIDRQLCSLSYTRIDDAARRIVQLGPGTLLAKLDLQSAYRIVPVHADDRPLLGVRWGNDVFLDAALPFGAEDFLSYSRRIVVVHVRRRALVRHPLLGRLPAVWRPRFQRVRRQLVARADHMQSAGRASSATENRGPGIDDHFYGD